MSNQAYIELTRHLRVATQTPTSIELKWSVAAGSAVLPSPPFPVSFTLYCASEEQLATDVDGSAFQLKYEGPAMSYKMTGLPSGTTYKIRLCALNDDTKQIASETNLDATTEDARSTDHILKALLAAVTSRDTTTVRDLCTNTPRQQFPADGRDKNGRTLLMLCGQYGDAIMAHALMTAGVSPSATTSASKTALMYASAAGNLGVVKVLAEVGKVKIDGTDNGGSTALMWAADAGYADVVSYLINRGADVNSVDSTGNTPLTRICSLHSSNVNVAKILLQFGAQINRRNEASQTALMLAALNGHSSMVQLLLQKGADPAMTNASGNTALALAKAKRHEKVVHMLDRATESNIV